MTDAEVAALAERIKQGQREARDAGSVGDHRIAYRHYREYSAAKEVLAAEFAERRGWRRGSVVPSPRSLREHRFTRAQPLDENWEWPDFDHREGFVWRRRPVAMVSHTYSKNLSKARAWVEGMGLYFETPQFPSWYYPGGTKLVVVTWQPPE